MTTTRLAVLLAAFFALATGTASAQTAAPCAECQAPSATPHHPRLYRLLEVISEPSVIFNPSPYPGYVPTTHPFLDAAPNVANLVFLGLSGINSTPLGVASFLVPIGIRVLRISLYGMPFPATRGETALWVVWPALVHMRRNYQQTGHLFNPPLTGRFAGRPMFPRLYARRHGNSCECR